MISVPVIWLQDHNNNEGELDRDPSTIIITDPPTASWWARNAGAPVMPSWAHHDLFSIAPLVKPYRFQPISECFEPLVALNGSEFSRVDPHPYLQAGANYRGASPWQLRAGVVARLQSASITLNQRHPGWKLHLFDAYRPISVQNDMVRHEFLLWSKGRHEGEMSEAERDRIYQKVYRIWAVPSDDPTTPPPHSTGAAIDITLLDAVGSEVWMGSPIDENSDRSNPDYFKTLDPLAHAHRQALLEAMASAGFTRHPEEWWHFSYGDQMWAWLSSRASGTEVKARYGRADLI